MKILAIDPGTTESAYCYFDSTQQRVGTFAKLDNKTLRIGMKNYIGHADMLVVEMIASYGMPVGAEVFETVVWIGRFLEAWDIGAGIGKSARLKRIEVKSHLCHSGKANDANIRQALIDRFGPVGTKKNPGKLYGVSGDIWAALAVAVTYADKHGGSHGQTEGQ